MEAIGLRRAIIGTDRGARQQHKILGLLAVAQADGETPLAEMLIEGSVHVRRGTVALVVTPSLDHSWVAPLAALRNGGVSPIACVVDPPGSAEAPAAGETARPDAQSIRAMLHMLAEHDVRGFVVRAGSPLGEQLVSSLQSMPVASA